NAGPALVALLFPLSWKVRLTRCTDFWMPAVNKENHKGRGKHATKIDRSGQRRSCSPLQNSGYPEKQQHIDKQMHPVEMQKRICSEAPVLSMQVPVVWKC